MRKLFFSGQLIKRLSKKGKANPVLGREGP
jgi:hypothetical protein